MRKIQHNDNNIMKQLGNHYFITAYLLSNLIIHVE